MVAMIKVHAGDFVGMGSYSPPIFSSGYGSLHLKTSGWQPRGEKITKEMIQTVELASEEAAVRLGGAAGWGTAGVVLLGPVGLLAGLVLGGRGKDITFIVVLKDGRKAMLTADSKTYTAIKAAVF
ncbi:hypothetical protein [Alkanindiges illinoisensis]|uniref:hypothetical protein n=1 Tax=Alkanindiges illinoisensis TaxID=197183 RepID=UPI000687C7BF|nr:hypothetical protein [Alkanindiges illinoisensis]